MGRFLIVVPASGLLNHLFSFLQKFDLAGTLALDGTADSLKGVQVFHFRTGAEFLCSYLPDRQVHVRTHGTLLQLAVGSAQILNDQAELVKIGDDLLGAAHIRLGHNLNQRHAAPVIVHQGAVLPFIVNQLSGVLLHMNLMDADLLAAVLRLDLHIAVPADRRVKLGNLIVLGVIRIKIVFPVKFAVAGNLAVGSQPHCHGIFHDLFVQHRKGTGHAGAHRAGVGVGRSSELRAAGAENLRLRSQLHMNFQTDHGLILLTHCLPLLSLLLLSRKGKTPADTFVGIGCLNDFIFLETVSQKLQTDGQPLAVRSTGQADARKARQVCGDRINITQIHFQRIA